MSPCTVDWAAQYLPEDKQDELWQQMYDNPDGFYLPIMDGDFMTLMAYAYDGVAEMEQRGTVAVLPLPEPAYGWTFSDGSMFVRVVGCGNWAYVLPRHGRYYGAPPVLAGILGRPAYGAPPSRGPGAGGWAYGPGHPGGGWYDHVPPDRGDEDGRPPKPFPAIPSVPLPAAGLQLFAALMGAAMIRRIA